MANNWPNKKEREGFEIDEFIDSYRKLPDGRSFEVIGRGDLNYAGPDYVVKDTKTGEFFGVELTSVYLDDRSVPDVHMKVIDGDDPIKIPCQTHKIKEYEKRLLEVISEKMQKAERYDRSFPLVLSVYVNEYISSFMDAKKFQSLVNANESLFDSMEPFSEIVFWPLPNGGAFSVKPETKQHT